MGHMAESKIKMMTNWPGCQWLVIVNRGDFGWANGPMSPEQTKSKD